MTASKVICAQCGGEMQSYMTIDHGEPRGILEWHPLISIPYLLTGLVICVLVFLGAGEHLLGALIAQFGLSIGVPAFLQAVHDRYRMILVAFIVWFVVLQFLTLFSRDKTVVHYRCGKCGGCSIRTE